LICSSANNRTNDAIHIKLNRDIALDISWFIQKKLRYSDAGTRWKEQERREEGKNRSETEPRVL